MYLGGIKNGGISSPLSVGVKFASYFFYLTILRFSFAASLCFLFLWGIFSKTKRRVAADYAEEADCDMIAYENGSLGLLPITFAKLYTENMDIK